MALVVVWRRESKTARKRQPSAPSEHDARRDLQVELVGTQMAYDLAGPRAEDLHRWGKAKLG